MDFFLLYSIVWFVWMFVVLGLMLFAEYTKLDEVESYFSHNERVRGNKRFWRRKEWIDRQYRMLLIFEFLSDSKRHVKAGVVTEAELASVPLALKRWVLWPYYLGFIWLITTVVWSVWRRWGELPI
ncbi:hypothetical protein [Pseudomonas salomonii]|jgi:hypothetical protein|uniref:Uncharacterized protein n=1 Tax=Pseudomonas salomonii TaxID=191391 RepID=A0ABS9GSR9_9PSED|nr:hypothetical protein [Pseudomonas salomonii]MCF5548585.1 hypothetical protein [Pseudomonas salomonii]